MLLFKLINENDWFVIILILTVCSSPKGHLDILFIMLIKKKENFSFDSNNIKQMMNNHMTINKCFKIIWNLIKFDANITNFSITYES